MTIEEESFHEIQHEMIPFMILCLFHNRYLKANLAIEFINDDYR